VGVHRHWLILIRSDGGRVKMATSLGLCAHSQ
jgi:hypothetical protein